eukprot:CAMPEP_0202711478 /NCGR_PEP_ID=MMETSP1385-20130828/23282_1 /ASSEMBLY_ACC=CAM_ASM_000861 /TAXON_ID=933848 /ORGANISM="Elphidium margaritaceum" /LENGTH=496 /DNA_ID=CAMNT_0049371225 /DNA_START=58 /DNA_END=1548 /DNA_ORIENTATION=-
MKNLSTSVLLSSVSKSQLISTVKSPSKEPHTSSSSNGIQSAHSRRTIKNRVQDGGAPCILTSGSSSLSPELGGDRDSLSKLKLKENGGDSHGHHAATHHSQKVSLFGVDLSRLPWWFQATLLITLILFGFILIGYVEEGFKFEFGDFSFGWFMTAVELLIFSMFAMLERVFKSINATRNNSHNNNNSDSSISAMSDAVRRETHDAETANLLHNNNEDREKSISPNSTASASASSPSNFLHVMFERQMPFRYHLLVAIAMMISRALTNIALLLLNYPTQVIFKSMKLISVMIGSVCCLQKSYHRCEYVGAPILVLSAILFTLGDANDLNFNVLGIAVVLVSLIFDAIHANSQQYILQARTERDTTMELLVYTNLMAGAMALVMSLLVGEVTEIHFEYLPHQPQGTAQRLLVWFVVRVACLYLGVSAFVVFTKRFGAVFAVTVTTIRKIMTVFLSYVFYPGKKVFIPMQHGTGTLLFILALLFWGYGGVAKKSSPRKH